MSIATKEVKENNLTHANSGNLISPPLHNGTQNRMRTVSMDGSRVKDLEILPVTQPIYHATSLSPTKVIEGKKHPEDKNTMLDITSHQETSITGESCSLRFT
jgi:hypothetical protein